MTFDKFKMWSVAALKDYLSKKAITIKTKGNKETLTARALSAWENNGHGVPDV